VNILTRQLVRVGAFNLSLILRKLLGAGTPRELKNRAGQVFSRLLRSLSRWTGAASSPGNPYRPTRLRTAPSFRYRTPRSFSGVLPRAANQFPDFRMESRIAQSSEEEILVNRAIILKSGDRSILLKN
jgi:hypothetical protein